MTDSDRQGVILATLAPLTEQQRADAAETADAAVGRIIGPKPRRDQFNHVEISEYPAWFSGLVALLLFAILLAASLVSVFRVFTAARDNYLQTIDDQTQAAVVGFAMFLMAEITVVVSTLAMRTFFANSKRMQRVFLAVAVVAAAIAIVGNAQVTRPVLALTLESAWQLLETLAPPVFVMATALVGERLIADVVKSRHADERAYKVALERWQSEIDAVRNHVHWRAKYRTALRDAIRKVNASGRGKADREVFMACLTPVEWTMLVVREELADEWYIEGAESFSLPQSSSTPEASGRLLGQEHRPLLPTPANSNDRQKTE